MAAAATDKLMEVGIATATTLDANYTINDTSITVASTSGWPTATGVAFAIDVVDSNGVQIAGTYNEYVGVVSSATSITSVDHVNGTDRNYSAGATTRAYIPVSAERENRIVEWGVVQHKQDGTHADTITTDTINENTAANGVTIDGLNIKDSKLVTANSVVTANITDGSILPEHLVASAGTSWAWQSWTPTWTNLTVSSSTVVAKYQQVGKTVHFRINVILGGGNAPGAGVTDFTLPVTAASYGNASNGAFPPIGITRCEDIGNESYMGLVDMPSSTKARPLLYNDSATGGNGLTTNALTATIPFTWANGDEFTITGTYEAA